MDQNGDPFAAPISWTATGGGSVAPASGTGAAEYTATFSAGPTAGEDTVTATSGSVTATLTLRIADYHLKVNCGPGAETVAGWEPEDDYVTGGEEFEFTGGTVAGTGGNTAPASLYTTVRHGKHAYSFPVPNGLYTLRMHFLDGWTDGSGRSMRYTAEGTIIVENFNIENEAGGMWRTFVKDFDVAVLDGNGLQLVCEEPNGGDVFESAIEVISAAKAQLFSFTSPLEGDVLAVGEVVTVAWTYTGDPAEVDGSQWNIELSTDAGDSWTKLNLTGGIFFGSTAWGTISWTVRAEQVSERCILRIVNYMDASERYYSTGYFSVSVQNAVTPSLHPDAIRQVSVRATASRIVVVVPQLTRAGEPLVRLLRLDGSSAHEMVVPESGTCIIDRTSIPAGTYLLRLDGYGETLSRRIICSD